jgi:hypothetical protein
MGRLFQQAPHRHLTSHDVISRTLTIVRGAIVVTAEANLALHV